LRTKSAAEVTAAAIGCNIRVDSGLNAISAGSLAGMREAQARQFAPGFVDDLELYRAGVCNSYHLTGYGEDVQEFERRVKASLERLLGTDFKVVVVVGHRSSITASLIFLARLSLDYPENFYGYIPLDLGHLSAMFIDSDDITWVGVNLSAEELDCRLGPRRL
jgi:broad specificity phosphatase PhoE